MGANEKHEAAMHGYVPSTESVREEYRNGRQFGELYSKTDFRAEFDRWLETVRAESKAEAWDEGWCVGWGNAWDSAKLTGAELVMTGNPYKEAPSA